MPTMTVDQHSIRHRETMVTVRSRYFPGVQFDGAQASSVRASQSRPQRCVHNMKLLCEAHHNRKMSCGQAEDDSVDEDQCRHHADFYWLERCRCYRSSQGKQSNPQFLGGEFCGNHDFRFPLRIIRMKGEGHAPTAVHNGTEAIGAECCADIRSSPPLCAISGH